MSIPFTHAGITEIPWVDCKDRKSARLPVGDYIISIQHSNKHYCDLHTVEVAVFIGKEFVKDFEATFPDNEFLKSMFDYDYVAGWVTADMLNQLIGELRKESDKEI